ncbi:MAG: RNA methyltransferase [Bacteroidetes bacterium]|nr:RNA methyltransferase [Bacteroidota bacterium]
MIKKLPHDQIPRFTLEGVKQLKRHPVTVLVHNVRSLYNVGSIFRTSDAAGIEKLILCGYTGYPPRKEIEKTALGSTASVAWEYEADIKVALQKLKDAGYKIAALEIATPSRHYTDLATSDFPLAMIIGNEITGVDDDLMDFCDFAIEIPQFGIKQSLNVAVAYGVGVFGIVERYRLVAPSEELAPIPMEVPPLAEAGESEID